MVALSSVTFTLWIVTPPVEKHLIIKMHIHVHVISSGKSFVWGVCLDKFIFSVINCVLNIRINSMFTRTKCPPTKGTFAFVAMVNNCWHDWREMKINVFHFIKYYIEMFISLLFAVQTSSGYQVVNIEMTHLIF